MTDKPIVNLGDLDFIERTNGGAFEVEFGRIGPRIGAEQLGCALHVVPAGKRAFPRHAHHRNEEICLVLDGEGEFRLGDERWPVKAGDIMAAPAGGPETAHHLVNTGTGELRYLTFSTMHDPEVTEYPDSNKFAVVSRMGAQGGPTTAHLRFIGRTDMSIDYFDGEEGRD